MTDKMTRSEISRMGALALHQKGLAHQWTHETGKAAGRKGGLATWKKYKVGRRGAELRIPLEVSK